VGFNNVHVYWIYQHDLKGEGQMDQFLLFVLMAVLLILLPGPDTVIATKNTLEIGRTGGLQTALGTCCALLIHTMAAVIGLSAIIVKSAVLFSVFKYVGAVYLVYMGVKAIWSLKKNEVATDTEELQVNKYGHTSCFRQGFLTNILNPKVAVFFLTFLPQFVNTEKSTLPQFLLMGLTYALLTAIWFLLYIYLINHIRMYMRKPTTQKFIQGISGIVLVGFGIKLALEKAHS
jgi:RhtB (resistance to homoserine/threonine) family protein